MEQTAVVVERARPEDLPHLSAIEDEAGTLFEESGLPPSVLESTPKTQDFAAALREGLLWVARAGHVPVGFALVEMLGGAPHLEEIDVLPSFGRRGIGARLLHAVLSWAREAGHEGVTLTTFRDVPWNRPFYAKHGFREVDERELSPALRAVVDDETARGLDPETRVTMICRFARRSTGGAP